MPEVVMLDTGPLGRIAHPRHNPEIADWIERLLNMGAVIVLPEIADYELRRNLLLEGLTRSIARLDQLKTALTYLPITTDVMLRAAELWADARRQGAPTAALHAGRLLSHCRVPFGKLTILDGDPGDPGLGKSTLILDLAARPSTARSMPDPGPAAPLSVPSLPSPAGANSATPSLALARVRRWLIQLQVWNVLEVSPVLRNEGQTMLEGRSGDDEVQCA
jgi:predicted nucleic acid-binding protein